MSDIAAASPPERLAHARAIRRRVKELTDQLGVRMPVYAIFTKADLLPASWNSSTIWIGRSAARSGARPSR